MLKRIVTLLCACYLTALIGCGQVGRLYLPTNALTSTEPSIPASPDVKKT